VGFLALIALAIPNESCRAQGLAFLIDTRPAPSSPAGTPQENAGLPSEFQERWSQLSQDLRDSLEAEGVVGASWAFVHGGKTVALETFGFADLATNRRVDDGTIYHWGSITKTLTGVAVMQLRDRGLLSLDDPIVDYVPELEGVHNPFGSMGDITIRHLLSHSAGFRNPTWPWGGQEPWHPHEPTTWDQLVAMIPYTEILFAPGDRFSYSNPGIVFLGETVRRLTGEEWEVYVEKNILRPLGMHRSYFDYTPYHLLKDRSNNYTVRRSEVTANGLDFDTGITVSNGGMNAPLGDMARYLAFLTDSGGAEARDLYRMVLDRSSLEEMWEVEVPIPAEGDVLSGMGLTFFLHRFQGMGFVGHTGSQKAFFSFIYIDPSTSAGAIMALNSNGVSDGGPPRPDARGFLNRMQERLFREIFPLFR
jgi:CubicO group peptidase (beta-lactamase class C family)